MPQDPLSGTSKGIASGCLAILLCLVSTVGTSFATGLLIGEDGDVPASAFISERLEALARDRDRVSMLLLGTSRVYRHVDPALLDKGLAEHGVQSFTFDLGSPSQTLQEQLHWLKQIKRMKLPRLQRILIEPTFFRFEWDNLLQDRVVNSHDLIGTQFVLRHPVKPTLGRAEQLKEITKHAFASASRLLWAGGLGRVVGRLSPAPEPAHGSAWRGNVFKDEEVPSGSGPAEDRAALAQRLTEMWAAAKQNGGQHSPLDPNVLDELNALGELLQEVRDMGAKPYIFLVASSEPTENMHGVLLGMGPDAPSVGYRNPSTAPELFKTELWFDIHHMNRAGAELYTRSLAGELAERFNSESQR